MATLDDLVTDLFDRPDTEGRSFALVVQLGGEVVVERYGIKPSSVFEAEETPIGADSTLVSWSMAKSMTHAALGLLAADGRIEVDARAAVPEWAGSPKEAITLLDLLEMGQRRHVAPLSRLVDGRDVMRALGLSPGPAVGRLLERLAERQEAGLLRSREEALDYLARLRRRTKPR